MSSRYLIRAAFVEDTVGIESLIFTPCARYIGNILTNLDNVIGLFEEYQTFRLVALDRTDMLRVVAYAEFRDYPNIPALPPDCWLTWLKFHYCINLPITLMNTLFLNSCIYLTNNADALKDILTEVCCIEVRVEYLLIVQPPHPPKARQSYLFQHFFVECYEEFKGFGKQYFPLNFIVESCQNTQSVLVIHAEDILPTIAYRRALPEDNDDVVELLDFEMPHMRKELGDFYIAEELLHQDEQTKQSFLIVVEFPNDDLVGGFLWLSSDIDIAQYVQDFELNQFGNFVKFDECKPYTFQSIDAVLRREKPEIGLFTQIALKELQEKMILGGLQSFNSGMSVASISKYRLTSVTGKLYATSLSVYYERENFYTKLKEVYNKVRSLEYYVMYEERTFYFMYNTCGKSLSEATPNDTSNVFVLRLCNIHRNYTVDLLYKFLIAALSAYPDRDYCLMLVPKTAKLTSSQRNMLHYFSLVSERSSKKQLNDHAYVLHRSTIQGELSVHKLRSKDRADIKEYVRAQEQYYEMSDQSSSSLSPRSMINVSVDRDFEMQAITYILNDALENPFSEYTVFTIRCGNSAASYENNTFVGFIVLRNFYKYHLLHYHFKVKWSPLKNEQRAEIIMFKLHPFFHIWSLQILRDVARNTGFVDFYFLRTHRYTRFSNDLIKNMMPVEPLVRKKVWYQKLNVDLEDNLYAKLKLPPVDLIHEPVEIFHHNLLPEKLFTNEKPIVIVGFTNLSKALLRQLVFQWNSKKSKNTDKYTCLPSLRVTVIVAPGVVEAEYDTKFVCPVCKDKRTCYLSYDNNPTYVRDCTARMDLRHWAHFVPAFIDKIDREKRIIKLNNSCDIAYDTLVLSCPSRFALNGDLKLTSGLNMPVNVDEMNSRFDRILLLHKLQLMKAELNKSINLLIYGSNIPAYECINFLLTHGIDAESITLVMRYARYITDEKMNLSYHDGNIQYILEDMVADLGVHMHKNLEFAHFIEFPEMDLISGVVFKHYPNNKLVTFNCDLFINFDDGPIDHRTKIILKQSGIEMSGNRILIDENFRTNDPNIYALGRYVEMRPNPFYQYEHTSARETAEKLLRVLNLAADNDRPFERRYSQPTYFQARLPLNYCFAKLTLPRRYLRNQLSDEYSCRLTTYYNGVFFRVRLNPRQVVDELVCVSKKNKNMDFLEHICGKHELLLNNLMDRYKAGNIKCFLKFFEEPWTELIMHEDFEIMQAKNHAFLQPLAKAMFADVERSVPQMFALNEFNKLNKTFLEQRLLHFIRKRRHLLVHEFALPEDYPQSQDFRKSLQSTFSI